MPRPVSWLPRLHAIRQAVQNSVRSHYDRRDLERLFELQPRAAQKLLELLPTVPVGTAKLVEREALAGFLDGVREAEDVSKYVEQVRQTKVASSRRRLRSLVRADLSPVSLTSLPQAIRLAPGSLEVRFQTLEELAEAMLLIARLLQDDGEALAERCESKPALSEAGEADEEREEVAALFAELEAMEAERALSPPR